MKSAAPPSAARHVRTHRPGGVTRGGSRAKRQGDLGRGEKFTCKLAYPAEADPVRPSVSVAAPLGTAMLGARVGQTIACWVGEAVRCVKVERIFYQPEAAGDFHL